MNLEQITDLFQFAMVAKLFVLVLVVFYFVFLVVIYRQASLMTQILNSNVSPLLKTIIIIQIVAAAGLFFLAVVLI